MWEPFTIKRTLAKTSLSDAEKEMQDGIQGIWLKESPFKQEMELVKRSSDLSFNGLILRRTYYAGMSGDWESYKEEIKNKASSVYGQENK